MLKNIMRCFKDIVRQILLLALVFSYQFAWSQANEVNKAADPKYVPPGFTMPAHPRILLLAGQEQGIKTAINKKGWSNLHQLIIDECDKMVFAPNIFVKNQQQLLPESREALRRLFFLSYSWRITRQQKYFDRAKIELLNLSSFKDWNPSHFLDVAEMTMGVSIAYDWLFDDLSQSDRLIIKNAIVNKGLKPSFDAQNDRWLQMHNNWNQVCNAGMLYGALATFDDNPELSKKVIDRGINYLKVEMASYAPDGNYPEGYVYWLYGTTFNVMAIDALQKVFKTDFGLINQPGFLKTADFLTHLIGPTGKAFNYSDATTSTEIKPNVAMLWFSHQLKKPSLLWPDKANLTSGLAQNRLLPAALIWNYGLSIDSIGMPAKTMWVGGGDNQVVMMRTSWAKDAIYAGFKLGSADNNHGHMDVGSFVMDADGERWALDLGMVDYRDYELKGVDLWNMKQLSPRWGILNYNNFSHNTLTINAQLQQVKGVATIAASSSKPLFMWASSDLKKAYGNVAALKRGIAIVDKSYVVVRDELKSLPIAKQSTIKWSMVTAAEVQIIDHTTARLTQNGKSLTLKVQAPANVVLTIWPLPIHSIEDKKAINQIIGFEVTMPANTQKAITVLLIPESGINKATKLVQPIAKWPVN